MTAEPKSVPVPVSKRLVLINSVSGLVARVLTVGVFAWVIQYLMRKIPEDELALLPIVLSFAMVLPLLQSVLTSGLARFVTEAYARYDLAGVTKIVSSQAPLLLLAAIVVTALGGAVAWYIDHILIIPPSLIGKTQFMMLLIVGRIAVGMITAPFNTGLYANQRFVLLNSIDVASSLLRVTLMAVLVFGVGPNVEYVIIANIAAQLFSQITSTVISMRLMPALRFNRASFDWDTAKRVLSFGGWSFFSQSANAIRRSADAPLLNLFSTPVAVNDFFLGSYFETGLRQTAIIASKPLLPALTAMHAHEQHERLAAVFLRGARVLLWASMFLAVPMMIFSHDLFALYLGPSYRAHATAANVMILLLLSFPFTYPTSMFSYIAYAQGNIRPIAIRGFASQILNLALTFILVGWFRMGAMGSAAATIMSIVFFEPFINWPLALRTLEIPWRRFISQSLIPGLAPAAIAACVGLLSASLVGPSSLAPVAVGVPACTLTYAVGVLIAFKPADRADLTRVRRAVGA